MTVLGPVEPCPYKLRAEYIGGVLYVDAQNLLDTLDQRATLVVRTTIVPGLETRMTDFNRGRFAELQDLYNELQTHVRR